MKFTLFLIITLYSLNIKANTNGQFFNPTKDIDFPDLYFLGHNFIQFPLDLKIDSIAFNNHLWEATDKENSLFCFNINRHPLMQRVEYKDTVEIILYGLNRYWKYKVKIIPLAELLISATSFKTKARLKNNSKINFTDTLIYQARWDYPAHVKGYMRFRGIFRVEFQVSNKRVHAVTGWYDAGDRTKPIYLERFSHYENLHLELVDVKLPYQGNILNLDKKLTLSDKSTFHLFIQS